VPAFVFLDSEDDEQTRTVSAPIFPLTYLPYCNTLRPPLLVTVNLFIPSSFSHTLQSFLIYQISTLCSSAISQDSLIKPSLSLPANCTMAPSPDHTIEEAAAAHANLLLQPHEKTSPNAVPRSAHTHASQQAVNVPTP
jgi:hypothetical protein